MNIKSLLAGCVIMLVMIWMSVVPADADIRRVSQKSPNSANCSGLTQKY